MAAEGVDKFGLMVELAGDLGLGGADVWQGCDGRELLRSNNQKPSHSPCRP